MGWVEVVHLWPVVWAVLIVPLSLAGVLVVPEYTCLFDLQYCKLGIHECLNT